MLRTFSRGDQLAKRRQLRRESTYPERALWNSHRRNQILGIGFRRQHSVFSYVLDFYAPSVRMAIEVDGETHLSPEQQEYDRKRQREIEALGITFLRFTNDDVVMKSNWVVAQIERRVKELLEDASLLPNPPRSAGRGPIDVSRRTRHTS